MEADVAAEAVGAGVEVVGSYVIIFRILFTTVCGNSSVVERFLAKEEAAGSKPVSRSINILNDINTL